MPDKIPGFGGMLRTQAEGMVFYFVCVAWTRSFLISPVVSKLIPRECGACSSNS